jgi:hypothetical protein
MSLGVEMWKSSQKWSVERSDSLLANAFGVRSIAWLDFVDSQTKCNTDDVWREGKKKGLEGEEEWPEGGNEVSATQWEERSVVAALGGAREGGRQYVSFRS